VVRKSRSNGFNGILRLPTASVVRVEGFKVDPAPVTHPNFGCRTFKKIEMNPGTAEVLQDFPKT
jgi:hypothetical protein